jgi:hypothetical protein
VPTAGAVQRSGGEQQPGIVRRQEHPQAPAAIARPARITRRRPRESGTEPDTSAVIRRRRTQTAKTAVSVIAENRH